MSPVLNAGAAFDLLASSSCLAWVCDQGEAALSSLEESTEVVTKNVTPFNSGVIPIW